MPANQLPHISLDAWMIILTHTGDEKTIARFAQVCCETRTLTNKKGAWISCATKHEIQQLPDDSANSYYSAIRIIQRKTSKFYDFAETTLDKFENSKEALYYSTLLLVELSGSNEDKLQKGITNAEALATLGDISGYLIITESYHRGFGNLKQQNLQQVKEYLSKAFTILKKPCSPNDISKLPKDKLQALAHKKTGKKLIECFELAEISQLSSNMLFTLAKPEGDKILANFTFDQILKLEKTGFVNLISSETGETILKIYTAEYIIDSHNRNIIAIFADSKNIQKILNHFNNDYAEIKKADYTTLSNILNHNKPEIIPVGVEFKFA